MANGYKYITDPGLLHPNNKIAFDVDFSTAESAAKSAFKMVQDKAKFSVVKGLEGDERIAAIYDFAVKEVTDNLVGEVKTLCLDRYRQNMKLKEKIEIIQEATQINPSVGAIISAFKKAFGEVSAAEPLFKNFPELTQSQIKRIEDINAAVVTINREQADEERERNKRGNPISDLSKAEKRAFFERFDKRREEAIAGFMPYKILNLNYTHLPQTFRNNEAKQLKALFESDEYKNADEKSKMLRERENRKSILVIFKKGYYLILLNGIIIIHIHH